MSGWNMSRSITNDWKSLSFTSAPLTVILYGGDAIASATQVAPDEDEPELLDFADTTSASLSLTVHVARTGFPFWSNIVYFVDREVITHEKFWNVFPHTTTQRGGRRSSSFVDP